MISTIGSLVRTLISRLGYGARMLLALFAAAQAEDYARLDAHLAWLLADAPRAPFPAAACLVAQALSMSGYVLRLPTIEAARPPEAADDGTDNVLAFRRRAS